MAKASQLPSTAERRVTEHGDGTFSETMDVGDVGVNQIVFGPASSTTYPADSCLSGALELTNMARVPGGGGLMTGGLMEFAANFIGPVDLVIFRSQPAGTYTAGAPFVIDAADRNKVSKVIKLTEATKLGPSDTLLEAVATAKLFRCTDTTKTTSLWVVPVTRSAVTLASAADVTLTVRASRN